jgi:hypothetical protein
LQLATYSWLLSPEQIDVQCAYYLFPTQKLLYKANADWKTLWQNAHSCWVERMTSLRHGILKKGSDNESELKNSPLPLPLAANCRFCNFSALCKLIEE